MKKNIAVLMGGRSLEREISIKSGQRISNALRKLDYNVIKLDVDDQIVDNLNSSKIDLAYIALHGKDGEDGTIQEIWAVLTRTVFSGMPAGHRKRSLSSRAVKMFTLSK